MLRGDAADTNLLVFPMTRLRFEPTICRTRGKHVNHNIINAVKQNKSQIPPPHIFCEITYFFFLKAISASLANWVGGYCRNKSPASLIIFSNGKLSGILDNKQCKTHISHSLDKISSLRYNTICKNVEM